MLAPQELRSADLPALGLGAAALTGTCAALFVPISANAGVLIAATCAIAALVFLFFARNRASGSIAAYATLAALVFATAQSDLARDDRAWLVRHDPDTAIVSFRGVVALKEESGDSRVERLWCEQVRLDLPDTASASNDLRVRLAVPLAAGSEIEVGDAVACAVRLEPAHERQRNSVRELTWSLRTRNWADARLVDEASLVVVKGGHGISWMVHEARALILHQLSTTLSPDAAAIAGALLLGSREALSSDFRADIQLSGLAHLFALSGLNTGLIVSVFWIVMAWLFVPRRARYVVLLVVLICYTLLGLSVPSLFRSAVMAGLWIVGRLLAKSSHPANLLLFAFAVELFFWPLHLLDAGFLLSYLSMAGMLAAYIALMQPFQELLSASKQGVRRRIADTLSSTVGAQLATAPIAGLLFARVPGLAILANIVAIPAFSLLVVLLLILLLVSSFSAALAAPIARSVEATVWGFAKMSSLVAHFPGAGYALSTSAWVPAAAFVAQCAAIGYFLRARRLIGIALTLLSVNLLIWPGQFSTNDVPTMRVFGSEHQKLALLTSGEFSCLMGFGAEAEGERNASLIREAQSQGRDATIDVAVTPNEKAQVVGGAAILLDQIPTDLLLDFSTPRETMTASMFRAAVLANDVRVHRAVAGDTWTIDGATLEVEWPPSTSVGNGCVLRVTIGDATVLFVSGISLDEVPLLNALLVRDARTVIFDLETGVVQHSDSANTKARTWQWTGASWIERPSNAERLMSVWSLPGYEAA